MYCKNCGQELTDEQKVCPNCGYVEEEKKSPITITINSQGMIWYNILKYGLWVLAAIRLLVLILPPYNKGGEYILSGIFTSIEIFLMTYVAYELHVYRKDAPQKVQVLLWFILVSNIIVAFFSAVILATRYNIGVEFSAVIFFNGWFIFTVICDVAMIIINKIYFKHRSDKFTKEGGYLLEDHFSLETVYNPYPGDKAEKEFNSEPVKDELFNDNANVLSEQEENADK